jgi:hypothetical protein
MWWGNIRIMNRKECGRKQSQFKLGVQSWYLSGDTEENHRKHMQ